MILNFYALIDPRTDAVRYVGKTQQRVGNRLYRHVAAARAGRRSNVNVWIRTLLAEELRPQVKVLEVLECEPAVGSEREKFWIARHIDMECRLLNMTAGGFGSVGYTHNEESRRKIKEARARQVFTAEHRAAISAALIGNTNSVGVVSVWKGRKRGPMSDSEKTKRSQTMVQVRSERFWSTRPVAVS